MKLGIVGGNSHVGTELCFIFRNFGIESVPILRNDLGATFLRYHGFQCRIGDVSDSEAAQRTLNDIDVVVVAAYDTKWGKEGRETNMRIVSHSVKFSAKASKIVYLSSIRAYSRQVDRTTPRWWMAPAHDREKRHLESHLRRESGRYAKDSTSLRCGHVFGKNQLRTAQLINKLSLGGKMKADVDGASLSNVVHTVTIADAILACAHRTGLQSMYSLVNHPQWSWREVFDYYSSDGAQVAFLGGTNTGKGLPMKWDPLKSVYKRVMKRGGLVFTLKLLLPEGIRRDYSRRFLLEQIRSEIGNVGRIAPLRMHEFVYKPVPGPELPGLSNTKALLKTSDVKDGIFGD